MTHLLIYPNLDVSPRQSILSDIIITNHKNNTFFEAEKTC